MTLKHHVNFIFEQHPKGGSPKNPYALNRFPSHSNTKPIPHLRHPPIVSLTPALSRYSQHHKRKENVLKTTVGHKREGSNESRPYSNTVGTPTHRRQSHLKADGKRLKLCF
ncbi:hypothetical protein JTE90_008026 [Oedothorax gibbosus]|uniref:Uncharacterized protein n=1 Tax=Oedothorax gibbosus TaxID=931172 RepID=A0AAV6UYS6_9ARAC|nr:hypothetical protein JTE90_008026 [Oedothorax gibbosus]